MQRELRDVNKGQLDVDKGRGMSGGEHMELGNMECGGHGMTGTHSRAEIGAMWSLTWGTQSGGQKTRVGIPHHTHDKTDLLSESQGQKDDE